MNAHICGRVLPFSREKVLQHDAINKLTCEDAIALAKYGSQARFWLWAPARYKTGLKTPNMRLPSTGIQNPSESHSLP